MSKLILYVYDFTTNLQFDIELCSYICRGEGLFFYGKIVKLGIYLFFFVPLALIFTSKFRIRKVLENKSNTEEDRVAIVEAQLAQAKLIAEEADRKYEEVKLIIEQKNKFKNKSHPQKQPLSHI